jgi:hypothetical protein
MAVKLLADLIVVVHFAWILFMLIGFVLTLLGFWWKRFFDKWLFRTLHLLGIVYVGLLAVLREYCPLTVLENALREKYDPYLTYPGSFIVHYLQRLVYPDIQPLMILIPTMIIAIFTILVFIFRPPRKIKRIFVKFFL